MSRYSLIQAGSVDDIRSSLACNYDSYTVEYLEQQVELEKSKNNRISVIKMLTAAIKRKKKAENATR